MLAVVLAVVLAGWLVGGLVVGLAGGLAGGLFLLLGYLDDLLSITYVDISSTPNQVLHQSARSALTVGLIGGLAVGLFSGLVVGLVVGLAVGLVYGPGAGLVGGLGVGLGVGLLGGLGGGLGIGLNAGGQACLQHLVLRFLLVRGNSMPLNYVKFLDYADERILLRRVGGGYEFFHGMLLEYFAAQAKADLTAANDLSITHNFVHT